MRFAPSVMTHRPRGSALVFVLCLVLVLAIASVAIVRVAGNDRTSAARMGMEDRGLACAEAGLQYARWFFGSNYETSHGWNDFLNNTTPGFRFDPSAGDTRPSDGVSIPSGTPAAAQKDFDGSSGADVWVSIHDDDDERPMGIAANDPTRDNNEVIIIRSECFNPRYRIVQGGKETNVVLESTLAHIQGGSGYATSGPTNSPDIVGGR